MLPKKMLNNINSYFKNKRQVTVKWHINNLMKEILSSSSWTRVKMKSIMIPLKTTNQEINSLEQQ